MSNLKDIYKKLFGVDFLFTTSGNNTLLLNSDVTINNSITANGNIFTNTLNIGNSLYLNNNTKTNNIFSNSVTANNITFDNLIVSNISFVNNILCNDTLYVKDINVSSTGNINNFTSTNLLIKGNLDANDITINNICSNDSITINSNIINFNKKFITRDENLILNVKDVYIKDKNIIIGYNENNYTQYGIIINNISGNNGFITTDIYSDYYKIKLPNSNKINNIATITLDENFYVSNTSYINNNLTCNSLFVNKLTFSNELHGNNLSVLNLEANNIYSNTLNSNNMNVLYNVETNNIFINNDLITNNLSSNSLFLKNDFIANNITCLNNIYINNTSGLTSNLNVSGNINVNNNINSNNINIIQNMTSNKLFSLNVYSTNISINSNLECTDYNSSTCNVINNVTSNSLIINNATVIANGLYTNNIIRMELKHYNNSKQANANGVPVGGLFRTYNIVKICLDTTAPILELVGGSNYVIKVGSVYYEPGVNVLNETCDVYLVSIKDMANIEYITNIIKVSANMAISFINTSVESKYIFKYFSADKNSNITTMERNVIIPSPPFYYHYAQHTGLDGFYKINNDMYKVYDGRFPGITMIYFKNKYYLFSRNSAEQKSSDDLCNLYAFSSDRINWTMNYYFLNISKNLYQNESWFRINNVCASTKYILVFMYSDPGNRYRSLDLYRSEDGINWNTTPIKMIKSTPERSRIDSHVHVANDVIFHLDLFTQTVYISKDYGDTWFTNVGRFQYLNYKSFAIYVNNIYFIYFGPQFGCIFSSDLIYWDGYNLEGKYAVINPWESIPEIYHYNYYIKWYYYTRFVASYVSAANNYIIMVGSFSAGGGDIYSCLYIYYIHSSELSNAWIGTYKWRAIPIIPPEIDNKHLFKEIRACHKIFGSPIYYINNKYHMVGRADCTCIDIKGNYHSVIIFFNGTSENLADWIFQKNQEDIIISSNYRSFYDNKLPIIPGDYFTDILNGEIFVLNEQGYEKPHFIWTNMLNVRLCDYCVYSMNDLNNTIVLSPIYEFNGGILYDNYWNVCDKTNGTAWSGDDINKDIFKIINTLYHGFSISMNVTYDGYGWYTENNILYNNGSVEFFMFNTINSTNKCGIRVTGNNMYFYGTNNTFIQLASNISITGTNNWLFIMQRHGSIRIYKNNELLLNKDVTFDHSLLLPKLTFGNSFDTKKAFMRNCNISNIKVWDKIIILQNIGILM